MTERHYIVATAGHVDHGKSSLVKALTGTDPDRLPEEKARQITIDLGFAELNLGDGIHAAIVDVPGHENFVRNMIAGVGSIDLALLVVAADDGWMPQTEEHLQILTYFGVNRAVIALTKTDLGDAERVEMQIRERLIDTPFADASIARTSLHRKPLMMDDGMSCDGVAGLKQALAIELSQIQPQRDIRKPRLFVDRAFTLHGIGTVVTGTLTGGSLRRGDAVFVQPRNIPARIRSIQTHGRDVDLAQPGTRTAINLPDLAVDEGIARGDVVTLAHYEPSSVLDVVLQRSPRLGRVPAIKSHASVYVHHGTKRTSAKIILRDKQSLAVGETTPAQLRMASPILAFLGDRFVVRDASEQHTIAGGIILNGMDLDAHEDVDLCAYSEIARVGPTRFASLLRNSNFSAGEINAALQGLHHQNKIFLNGEIAADITTWKKLRDRATASIEADHRSHPERSGMEFAALRANLSGLSPEVFEALLVDLCAENFGRVGSTIARRSHRPALPAALQKIATHILAHLSEKPFDPPNQKSVDPETHKAIRFLIQTGELIELKQDVVILSEAFAKMKMTIANFISAHGPASVSQLRQELGTSRRIIVPLLELLDRQGVTRRGGDKRMLA